MRFKWVRRKEVGRVHRRGHRRRAAYRCGFVDPAKRRREQDDIDAKRMLVAGGDPRLVARLIGQRGQW